MSTATKTENYTAAMVARIKASAPLTFEKAEALAAELGKTARSIISKARSEGIAYERKPAPTKKPKGITKAHLVAAIADKLGVSGAKLEGLDKAPTAALNAIISALSVYAKSEASSVAENKEVSSVEEEEMLDDEEEMLDDEEEDLEEEEDA